MDRTTFSGHGVLFWRATAPPMKLLNGFSPSRGRIWGLRWVLSTAISVFELRICNIVFISEGWRPLPWMSWTLNGLLATQSSLFSVSSPSRGRIWGLRGECSALQFQSLNCEFVTSCSFNQLKCYVNTENITEWSVLIRITFQKGLVRVDSIEVIFFEGFHDIKISGRWVLITNRKAFWTIILRSQPLISARQCSLVHCIYHTEHMLCIKLIKWFPDSKFVHKALLLFAPIKA